MNLGGSRGPPPGWVRSFREETEFVDWSATADYAASGERIWLSQMFLEKFGGATQKNSICDGVLTGGLNAFFGLKALIVGLRTVSRSPPT